MLSLVAARGTLKMRQVPPHQFGRMTYDRAIEVTAAAREEFAAVSHGLTSSPRWGEGAQCRADDEHKRRRESLLPVVAKARFQRDGRRWPEGPDEGAFK